MATPAAWRNTLQQPSFRGVPFKWAKSALPLGRRVVVYEYPKRDLPATEDMGRKAREFTLEGYVIGPEYHLQRDALIEALEKAGPGELVHPTRGRMMVVVVQATCTESTEEGGMARFSMTFAEAGEEAAPDARVDTTVRVGMSADDAQAAAIADFERRFRTAGEPGFVRTSALDDLNAALTGVYQASRQILPDLVVLSDFTRGLNSASATLSNIIGRPGAVAEQLFGQINSLSALAQRPVNAFSAMQRLFGFERARTPATTAARTRQAANTAAVVDLTRRAAIIEAARVSMEMDFGSSSEAEQIRDTLADALDEQMAEAQDEVYYALADLRAAVVRDCNVRGLMAPRLTTVTLGATLPAEVIAYRIYGDATRAGEIVARNRLRHPSFVPGGTALEVLVDD